MTCLNYAIQHIIDGKEFSEFSKNVKNKFKPDAIYKEALLYDLHFSPEKSLYLMAREAVNLFLETCFLMENKNG